MANGTEVNEEQYRKLQREIITTENKLKSLNDSVKSSNANWDSVGKKMQDVGNKTTDVGKKNDSGRYLTYFSNWGSINQSLGRRLMRQWTQSS